MNLSQLHASLAKALCPRPRPVITPAAPLTPRFNASPGSQVDCGVTSHVNKRVEARVLCVCVGSDSGGRLVGGRIARFGRVEECFGFIEPMKIGVSCALFTFSMI